ncbi:MAG: hypothetical protein WC073_07225 [Sterolibacterium sp.]
MDTIMLRLIAACWVGLFSFIPAANGQSMGGMNASVHQMEAIEGHLQQSRLQSSKETEESAKRKPRTDELPKPSIGTRAAKQKRAGNESEKTRELAGRGMKNEKLQQEITK